MQWVMLSRIGVAAVLIYLSYCVLTISYGTKSYSTSYGVDTIDHNVQPDHSLDAVDLAKTETATVTITATSTVASKPTAEPSLKTSSWRSPDGKIEHFILERPQRVASKSSVLFLTITNDEESWGRNPAQSRRTIYDHLDLVTNTTLLPEQMSLGLLTSSRTEFKKFIEILTPPTTNSEADAKYFDHAFARVVLVLHTAETRAPAPGQEVKSADGSRAQRHNTPQHERRAILGKLRNYLTTIALGLESHVAWLDADVYKYNSNTMIEYMLDRTTTTKEYEVGILTARCRKGEPEKADLWLAEHPDFKIPDGPRATDSAEERKRIEEMRGKEGGRYEILAHKTEQMGHYDLNAWSGRRTSPNKAEQEAMWKDISAWTPTPMGGGQTTMLDGVIEGTNDEDLKQLDSVGGTILMINAELIRMGLIWPTGYFIGMTFEHGEGFDGIESEGLCLLTRSFSRNGTSMCFTLGGSWTVWHTLY